MSTRLSRLSAVLGGLALSGPCRAHADVSCADPRVEIGEVAARWLSPLAATCEAMRTWRDRDRSARLRVAASGEDVVVEVRLGDGRGALRLIKNPIDLQPTIEALLTVPPSPPETDGEIASRRAPEVSMPTTDPSPPPPRLVPARLSVGAILGARLSGAPSLVGVGPAAHVDLVGERWLFGAFGRWDVTQRFVRHPARYRGFEMDTLALGVEAGRGGDVLGGRSELAGRLALVVEAQSFESLGGERAGTSTDARLGLVARFSPSRRSSRVLLALDGELSPSRLRRDLRTDPELPALPSFSIGLAVGYGWESP